jgi:hypothetical protein
MKSRAELQRESAANPGGTAEYILALQARLA